MRSEEGLEPRDEDELPARRRRPKRRKARMGEVVKAMGVRASALQTADVIARDTLRRERAEKAKALLDGGKNKGEELGFGVAKSLKP